MGIRSAFTHRTNLKRSAVFEENASEVGQQDTSGLGRLTVKKLALKEPTGERLWEACVEARMKRAFQT